MTPPVAMDDLIDLQRDLGAVGGKGAGRIVVCGDLTAASVFPEPLADRLARFFRADNQRLERVALVVGDSATYFMQAKDPDGKDVDYNRLQVDFIVKF